MDLEHCILHNLHRVLLVVIGDRQCLSRLFTRGRCLPLELDKLILLARFRASDSSRLNRSKDFWSLCSFKFWWKWRWYSDESDNGIGSRYYLYHINEMPEYLLVPAPCLARCLFFFFLYCWTIWGHGMLSITFSFPHHLSNSSIGSTPTKFDARSNTLLHKHYYRIFITNIITELLSSTVFLENRGKKVVQSTIS